MAKDAKTPLRFTAYAIIKEMLLVGDFLPGEVIDMSELAARLDLGRTPIREALLHLECDGILEILPKKGARVIPLDAPAIADLEAVIGLLEAEIVRQVANTATEQGIEPLRDCIGNMARAVELGHHEDWCRTQELYYRELHRLCPNAILGQNASENRDKCLRANFATLRLYDLAQRREAVQSSLDLTDFLAKNDPEPAVSHFRQAALARSDLHSLLRQNHGLQRL